MAGPAPSASGGGRFFPGTGAGRVAMGLTEVGAGEPSSSTGSTSALKLRLVRRGVAEGTYPRGAGIDILSGALVALGLKMVMLNKTVF